MTRRVSNMKASVSAIFCGFNSAVVALSKVARSGRVLTCKLCSDASAREKPFGLGVVNAVDEAHELVHGVAVEPGGGKCAPPPASAAGDHKIAASGAGGLARGRQHR